MLKRFADAVLTGRCRLVPAMSMAAARATTRTASWTMWPTFPVIPSRPWPRWHWMFTVMRYIDVLIPVILDKIHLTATCAIPAAIACPMLHVAGRHMQIHGWLHDGHGRWLDNHRLRVDHLWRRISVSNDNLPIKAGLTHADSNPSHCRDCHGSCPEEYTHDRFSDHCCLLSL